MVAPSVSVGLSTNSPSVLSQNSLHQDPHPVISFYIESVIPYSVGHKSEMEVGSAFSKKTLILWRRHFLMPIHYGNVKQITSCCITKSLGDQANDIELLLKYDEGCFGFCQLGPLELANVVTALCPAHLLTKNSDSSRIWLPLWWVIMTSPISCACKSRIRIAFVKIVISVWSN